MSRWIKKGDKIVVIAGNDRGKTGEVVARQGQRVIVQGVNIRKNMLSAEQKSEREKSTRLKCLFIFLM